MSKLRINDLESLDTGATVGVDALAGIPAELNRRVIYVDTIADLQALPTSGLVDGQQVQVKEYHAGTGVGGGELYFSAMQDKADHDGGYVIDPAHTVTLGTEAWYSPQNTGSGCFVRRNETNTVTPEEYGAKGDRSWNDYYAIKACHNNPIKTIEYLSTAKYMIRPPKGSASNGIPIYDGHDLRFNFAWFDCDLNDHQAIALYYFDTRQTAPTRFRRFRATNANLASSIGYPSEGQVLSPQYRHFIYIDGGWWQGVEINGIFTPEGGEGLACRSPVLCDLRSFDGSEPGVPDESLIDNVNLHYGWSTPACVVFLGDHLTHERSRLDTVTVDNILSASAPFIYDYDSFGTTNTRDGRFGAVIIDNTLFGKGPIGKAFDKYTAINCLTTGQCRGTVINWAKSEVKELRGTSRAAVLKGKFNSCKVRFVGQWVDIFNADLVGASGPHLIAINGSDNDFELLERSGRNPNSQSDTDQADVPSDWIFFDTGSIRNTLRTPYWANRDSTLYNSSDMMQIKMSLDPVRNTILSRLPDNRYRFDSGNLASQVTTVAAIPSSLIEYRDNYKGEVRLFSNNEVTANVRFNFSSGNFDVPVILSNTGTGSERRGHVEFSVIHSITSTSKGLNSAADSTGVRVFARVINSDGSVVYADGAGFTVNDGSEINVQIVHPGGGCQGIGIMDIERGVFVPTS